MGHYRLQIFMGPMWSGKTNRLIQAVDIARQTNHYNQVMVIKPLLDNRIVKPSISASVNNTTTPSTIINNENRPMIRARTGLSLPVDLYIHSLDDALSLLSQQQEQQQSIKNQFHPTSTNSHSYINTTVKHNTKTKPILYAIDEAQFFGPSLLKFWDYITLSTNHSLLLSGLDYDYKRQPFGSVLSLASNALIHPKPLSSQIYRLTARCAYQGNRRTLSSSSSISSPFKSLSSTSPSSTTEKSSLSFSSTSSSITLPYCNKPAAFTQRLKRGGSEIILVGGEEAYAPACEHHHIPEPVDEEEWGHV